MSTNQVATLLDTLTITLDPSLLHHITHFLQAHPHPPSSPLPPHLWTVAAAALLADAARVQPVSGQGRVSYGAPIEQFLRHVEGGERVRFLDAAARILAEWKQAPQNLTAKLSEVTRTYDVFSHYRALFLKMAKRVGFAEGVAQRVMAAFWIVFLRAKVKLTQRVKSAGPKGQLEVLFAIVDFCFEKVTTGASHQEVAEAFSQEFQRNITLSQQERDFYHKHFWEILEKGYHFRYETDPRIDLKALVQNQDMLRRFVEGFTLIFERERGSNFDQINELNYLQLQLPPLTPLPQQHKPMANNVHHELNTVLKYDEPEDCEQPFCNRTDLIDNVSSKKSPTAQLRAQLRFQQPGGDEVDQLFSHFIGEEEEDYAELQRRRKRFVVNKCHSRIFVLKWVQDQLRNAERAGEELVGLMGRSMDVKHYEESRGERIMALLEQVSSGCRDRKHRSAQIYRLFLAFLCKMRRGVKLQDFLAIIAQPQRLDAVLCLTSMIFNYAYKAQDLSFEEYCQHFGITLLTGFVPLNWFGANADLPKELQTFLFELEERILFEEIWRGETGMQLFRVKNIANFIQMAMRKRFYKHVLHRIACICKNELGEKDRNVVFKFVEEIITNKLHLLRDNNIYIILICSLNFCFGRTISLAKAIETLRKSENVGRLALQARDYYGYPVSIEEYYSSTFMREMELITNTRKDALQSTPPAKITSSSAIRNTATSESKSPICLQTFRFGVDPLSKGQECRVGHYRKVYFLAVKIFEAPCHSSPKSPSGSLSEQDE